MSTTSQIQTAPDIKQIRAMLVGVLFDCPLGGTPEDCICHHIRKLPASQRFEWVKQLSDEECREIHRNHMLCLKRKAGRTSYA